MITAVFIFLAFIIGMFVGGIIGAQFILEKTRCDRSTDLEE